jgi:hypothetical protein
MIIYIILIAIYFYLLILISINTIYNQFDYGIDFLFLLSI